MSYCRFVGFGGQLVVDMRKLGRAQCFLCPHPTLSPHPLHEFNLQTLILFIFLNSWNFNNSVYLFQGLPKGAMLTHRGTMATVVAAGAVLVRSFNWDIVIVFINICFYRTIQNSFLCDTWIQEILHQRVYP